MWNVYQEKFGKITNFQLLERKLYEVFKKDGIFQDNSLYDYNVTEATLLR